MNNTTRNRRTQLASLKFYPLFGVSSGPPIRHDDCDGVSACQAGGRCPRQRIPGENSPSHQQFVLIERPPVRNPPATARPGRTPTPAMAPIELLGGTACAHVKFAARPHWLDSWWEKGFRTSDWIVNSVPLRRPAGQSSMCGEATIRATRGPALFSPRDSHCRKAPSLASPLKIWQKRKVKVIEFGRGRRHRAHPVHRTYEILAGLIQRMPPLALHVCGIAGSVRPI